MVHDTQIEVMARRTVATWMQQAGRSSTERSMSRSESAGLAGKEPNDCLELSLLRVPRLLCW